MKSKFGGVTLKIKPLQKWGIKILIVAWEVI